MQQVTNVQLGALARHATEIYEEYVTLWGDAVKALPKDSLAFRQICSAGKKAAKVRQTLMREAERREWPEELRVKFFGASQHTSFN